MPDVRAVLLGRVSTDDKGQNVENQLGPLREIASRRGWTVVREIAIEGKSAWDEKESAEVRKMALESIRCGEADLLCVWALDRIYRGPPLGIFNLLDELHHLGAAFYSVQEDFLSTAGIDPRLRDVLTHIFAYIANMESQRRSERLKSAYANKRVWARNGGGRARWGRGLVASPEDIAEIRHLKADGLTVRAIATKVGLSKSNVATILKGRRGGR